MFPHLIAVSLLAFGGDATYPRADLLIEAPTLAAKAKDFKILDVRPKTKYGDQLHIAGAPSGSIPRRGPRRLPRRRIPRHGPARSASSASSPDSHVVLYDDAKAKDAARVWWILRYFGLKDARLLNGGWLAWKEPGYLSAPR